MSVNGGSFCSKRREQPRCLPKYLAAAVHHLNTNARARLSPDSICRGMAFAAQSHRVPSYIESGKHAPSWGCSLVASPLFYRTWLFRIGGACYWGSAAPGETWSLKQTRLRVLRCPLHMGCSLCLVAGPLKGGPVRRTGRDGSGYPFASTPNQRRAIAAAFHAGQSDPGQAQHRCAGDDPNRTSGPACDIFRRLTAPPPCCERAYKDNNTTSGDLYERYNLFSDTISPGRSPRLESTALAPFPRVR